jgi:hypothetical protein
MNSSPPATAQLTVFVPYFREKLLLEDFREILSASCDVESVAVHTKRFDSFREDHFYAFLTVSLLATTKAGRDLAKNLRNNTSTFVYFKRGNLEETRFIEVKPFLTKQQRIDRGYSGVTLYTHLPVEEEVDDAGGVELNSEADRELMAQEYEELAQEIYSLWYPSQHSFLM